MRRSMLILALLAVFIVPLAAFAQTDLDIAIGDTVEGSLTEDNLSAQYTLSGNAGDVVTISLESGDFDGFLTLLASDSEVLAEDDDSGGAPNPSIIDFVLPDSDDYTVVVDSYSRLDTGEYTLTVTGTEATVTPSPEATVTPEVVTDGTELSVGDAVSGTLAASDNAVVYTFAGETGDVVTITLESNDFDAYLVLEDAGGNQLATDDDSAGNLNSRIEEFELPADGTYTILAGSYGSGAEGDFTLTLEAGGTGEPTIESTLEPTAEPTDVTIQSGGAIEIGGSVSGTLAGEDAAYTFEGAAGDIVTVTLRSNDFDAYLTLQDENGVTLTEDDDSAGSLNARIQNFELPADGTYNILVGSLGGGGEGDYTLALETGDTIEPTTEPTVEPTVAPTEAPTEEPTVTPDVTTAPPGTIAYGETVSSTLNDGPNSHTFQGTNGDVVTITLESDDFDAYLRLLDPAGRELTTDDDSAGNLNARIENFELSSDGTYVIVAGGFSDTATGAYTLTLESGAAVEPTDEPTTEPTTEPTLEPTTEPTTVASGDQITLGDTVTGTLGSDLRTNFTFEGEAGQLVNISLSSEDFDTYLRLLGPDGTELITDDDSGGNLDSRISLYQLPSNGTYTVSVESFNGDTGDFNLSVTAASIDTIEYTQTIEGALEGGTASTGYRFTGEAGDVITINLTSGDFDSYLSLSVAGGDGYPLIENDDGGDGTNSLIGPYTLPSTGDYIITVRSYDNVTGGRYTLQLNQAELLPITFDEAVTAEFDAETGALFYSFEGTSGEVISIHVDSGGTIDTSLVVTGPDNYQLVFDDDSGADFDPEVSRLILSQDGTYTILLQPFASGDSGEVTLTLTRAAILSLDDGPQEVQLNEKVTTDVLTFEGSGGETVRLMINVLSGSSSAPAITVIQDGTPIATASVTGTSSLSLDFTVPSDGTVSVQISDYNFAKVVMEVSLERLEE